jgi:nucleoside-diphosphate-sugar epimerase
MTTVAITGASGFLGGALCRACAERGWVVRALVRDPTRFPALGGVTPLRLDLPDGIEDDSLAGADVLVHCAYATRESDLDRARRVNEEGTRRLLEATRRGGGGGGGGPYNTPPAPAPPPAPSYYARSKHALERLFDPARDAVVRPGLIVGPDGHGLFQQLLDNMRRLRVVPLFGGGVQPLQTVYVDDVCEAIVRIVERGLTGVFNVAEPEPPTLRAFLTEMADRLRLRVRFVPLPFGPVLAAVRGMEALHVPFPLRSESLLGLQGLRRVAVADDLARLEMRVRPAADSLDAAMSTSPVVAS